MRKHPADNQAIDEAVDVEECTIAQEIKCDVPCIIDRIQYR